ncbi:hypothetical protein GWK47_039262 [Chionoecetes opilio]|uniref:Regulatory protein zeste n=1 Tax=Chionoecetes opilio TaxID=41210 RepID=A0A8J5CLP7_CHIOP|nr:hypothetical protein GWK47_039262 [Chionoecetes opilio]
MAARYEASPSRATPISHVDKWVLLDLIKKHIEVINDKTTKLYGINKKAAAWQTIATKLNDLTGYMKTPKQIRKIWKNFRNRQQKLDEVHHQLQLIRSRQLSFPRYRMSWSHCTTLLTAIRYIMTKLSLKMLSQHGPLIGARHGPFAYESQRRKTFPKIFEAPPLSANQTNGKLFAEIGREPINGRFEGAVLNNRTMPLLLQC